MENDLPVKLPLVLIVFDYSISGVLLCQIASITLLVFVATCVGNLLYPLIALFP